MATNADSFSGAAAFSFEHHNPTPLFGMKAETQNQMQTQSPNHLMVDNTQVGFSSDYDMDTAKDNYVSRDEDFDIDLDIADHDDGDIDLDLATPMGVMEDDEQMGGVATAEEADDEMIDDATAEIHNEEMLDDDIAQQPQLQDQQIQQHAQQPRAASIFDAPVVNPPLDATNTPSEKPIKFTDLVQNTENILEQEKPLEFSSENSPRKTEASEATSAEKPSNEAAILEQEEPKKADETPIPPVEISEPQDEAAKPSSPAGLSPPTENSEKQLSPNLAPPKQHTPPSSNDAVRISQADTVPLENPTPEINQREWQAFAPLAFDGPVPTPEVPLDHEHQINQEIPTSPIHPSEHGSNSQEVDSQHEETSHPIQKAHEEASQHEDAPLSHPVIILYRDLEFSLFPVTNDGAKLPETSFLPDRSTVTSPLSKVIASLRDVLGDQFSASEEIVLTFTPLGVEFEEENMQASHVTLYELISLFIKLIIQDGIEEVTPLYISLSSRQKCLSKLDMIKTHVAQGGGMFDWNKVSGGLDNVQSLESEPQHYEQSHFQNHEDDEHAHNLHPEDDGHASTKDDEINNKSPEKTDEDLELEEFEKQYDEADAYYPEETHEEPPIEEAVKVDVPKSPSQGSFHQPPTTLLRETTNTDGSINVPETQFSSHDENRTPSNTIQPPMIEKDETIEEAEDEDYQEISSINGEQTDNHTESHITRDEDASFVTAQEKQTDTSRLRSLSHTGSYGFPVSPGSLEEEDPDYNPESKGTTDPQVTLANPEHHQATHLELRQYDDADHHYNLDEGELDLKEHYHQEQTDVSPAVESKSSSTLHEGSENELEDHTDLQEHDEHVTTEDQNWNEWDYVEEEAGEVEEYHEKEEEGGTGQELENGVLLETYDGLPTFTASGADNLEGEDDYNDDEFAYYPQHFSDFDHPEQGDEPVDDTLLGLEQHETLSTTASTKRARDDDEDEEEEGEIEAGEAGYSPSQASKRHRAL